MVLVRHWLSVPVSLLCGSVHLSDRNSHYGWCRRTEGMVLYRTGGIGRIFISAVPSLSRKPDAESKSTYVQKGKSLSCRSEMSEMSGNMNLTTLIILLAVLAVVVLAVRSLYKDKKSGKSCGGCGGCCSKCHSSCGTANHNK